MGRNDLLTEIERAYLNDPEGFDRAESTIRKINYDLRRKYQSAEKETKAIEAYQDGKSLHPAPGSINGPGISSSMEPRNEYFPVAGTKNRNTLLTPGEREFIVDPEGYADGHSDSTVGVMKHNLKQKHKNAQKDLRLLDETYKAWDKPEYPMGDRGRCIGCGREKDSEAKHWEATGIEESFPDWQKEYGGSSSGFCPDCSHIHGDTITMAIEEGKVPCYAEDCNTNTHSITGKPFRDCWKNGGIWLNTEDMDTLTDHIEDEDTLQQIQVIY